MSLSPFLIGIAGASGSGKSELARGLSAILSAPVISLDSYYRDLSHLSYHQRCQVNFDEPESLDADLLHEHFTAISSGIPIQVPHYDFSIHSRSGQFTPIAPTRFLILEGLFALHWPKLRSLLGVRVFVDLPEDICFARRLHRDVRERGRTEQSVHQQYASTVKPMCDLYILPTRAHADVVVRGDANLDDSVATVLRHCHPPGHGNHPAGSL